MVSLTSETYVIAFSSQPRLQPLLNEACLLGQAQGPPHRPPKA